MRAFRVGLLLLLGASCDAPEPVARSRTTTRQSMVAAPFALSTLKFGLAAETTTSTSVVSFDGGAALAWTTGAQSRGYVSVFDGASWSPTQHLGRSYGATIGLHGAGLVVARSSVDATSTAHLLVSRLDLAGDALEPPRALDSVGPDGTGYRRPFFQPALAGGGSQTLIAWNYPFGMNHQGFARLDSSGTILDAPARVLPTPNGSVPSVVFDGVGYVLAYLQLPFRSQVEVRQLAADASPVAVAPTDIINPVGGLAYPPSLVATDAGTYVAWSGLQSNGQFRVYGNRVAPNGSLLDSAPVQLSSFASLNERVAVAWFGGRVYVFSADQSGACRAVAVNGAGVAVNPAGAVVLSESCLAPSVVNESSGVVLAYATARALGTQVTSVAHVALPSMVAGASVVVSRAALAQRLPALAWGDGAALVAWRAFQPDAGWAVVATRVLPDSGVLDPDGLLIAAVPGVETRLHVTWGGGLWLVSWATSTPQPAQASVVFARVTPLGAVLDPGGVTVATFSNATAELTAAFDGVDFQLAWGSSTGFADDAGVRVVRVSPGAGLLDAGLWLGRRSSEEVSSVPYDGGVLYAWRDADGRSLVQRVGQGATLRDLSPAVLSGDSTVRLTEPFVVEDTTLLLRRGPAGATVGVLDDDLQFDAGVALDEVGPRVSFARGPGFSVLGWAQTLADGGGDVLRLMRVGRDGALLDSVAAVIELESSNATPPALVFDSTGHALVVASTFVATPGTVADRAVAFWVRSLPVGAACTHTIECETDRCSAGVCVNSCDAGACADAGVDAGTDAGEDAGTDAGEDAGVDAGEDAGVDAGEDAGVDAGEDAGVNAGEDAGVDGGEDAGIDSGEPDPLRSRPTQPEHLHVGCGCEHAGGSAALWLSLALRVHRRRRGVSR